MAPKRPSIWHPLEGPGFCSFFQLPTLRMISTRQDAVGSHRDSPQIWGGRFYILDTQ